MKAFLKQTVVILALALASISVCQGEPLAETAANPPESPVVADEQARQVEAQPPSRADTDDDQGWIKTNVEPQTSKVERIVMPFTNWVEEKIHKSTLVNPAAHQQQQNQPSPQTISLRQAIAKALAIHSGTVLSADRIETAGELQYRIKILSPGGVLREITVSGAADAIDNTDSTDTGERP